MPAGWCGLPAADAGKIPLPALRGGRKTGAFGGEPAVAVPVRSPRKDHSDVPGESSICFATQLEIMIYFKPLIKGYYAKFHCQRSSVNHFQKPSTPAQPLWPLAEKC
jgi:hypothetical protein